MEEEGQAVSEESIIQTLLGDLQKKGEGKTSKRKVLQKAGIGKFKDIENYIKTTRASRAEAK